jgi:hypothetical protein
MTEWVGEECCQGEMRRRLCESHPPPERHLVSGVLASSPAGYLSLSHPVFEGTMAHSCEQRVIQAITGRAEGRAMAENQTRWYSSCPVLRKRLLISCVLRSNTCSYNQPLTLLSVEVAALTVNCPLRKTPLAHPSIPQSRHRLPTGKSLRDHLLAASLFNITRCASCLGHEASELKGIHPPGSGCPDRQRMHKDFAEQAIPQMSGVTGPDPLQTRALN